MDETKIREFVRQGLSFVLRLALVLGGLGFASVFAVALLVGGIYLIATGHPTGGYALVGDTPCRMPVNAGFDTVGVLRRACRGGAGVCVGVRGCLENARLIGLCAKSCRTP